MSALCGCGKRWHPPRPRARLADRPLQHRHQVRDGLCRLGSQKPFPVTVLCVDSKNLTCDEDIGWVNTDLWWSSVSAFQIEQWSSGRFQQWCWESNQHQNELPRGHAAALGRHWPTGCVCSRGVQEVWPELDLFYDQQAQRGECRRVHFSSVLVSLRIFIFVVTVWCLCSLCVEDNVP